MKTKINKNILIVALSLVLVAVMAVGGTLAYIFSSTETVTNTFVGSDGIKMTLQEHKVDPATGKIPTGSSEKVQANSYTNIYPNKTVDKDPFITVTSAPQDGMDLFVKIDGVDKYMTVNGLAAGWEKVEGAKDTVNGIYKWNESVTLAEDKASKDFPVFTSVTFSNYEDAPEFSDIVITAYGVQTNGMVDGDTTVNLAIAALGATNTLG